MINFFVIETLDIPPRERAALRRGKILYGVKGKCGKVRYAAYGLTVPNCAKGVCSVRKDDNPSYRLLQVVGGFEKLFFIVYDFENPVVVAGDTRKVHGDDRFGLFGDSRLQLVVVHFKAVLLRIDKDDFRAYVVNNRRRCGICVSRGYNLVALTYPEKAESHFCTRCLGIQTHGAVDSAKCGNLPFKLFGFGSRSYPAGF